MTKRRQARGFAPHSAYLLALMTFLQGEAQADVHHYYLLDIFGRARDSPKFINQDLGGTETWWHIKSPAEKLLAPELVRWIADFLHLLFSDVALHSEILCTTYMP